MPFGYVKPGPESGYYVRKEYTSRINSFLRSVKPDHRNIGADENPLDVLFSWAAANAAGGKHLQEERQNEAQARNRLEQRVDNLRKEKEAAESKARQLTTENRDVKRQHEDDMQKSMMERSREMDEAKRKADKLERDLQNRMSNMSEDFKQRSHSSEMRFRNELARLTNDFNQKQAILESETTAKMEEQETGHKAEVEKLIGQLLVSSDDNLGWVEDKLKHKFQVIQIGIDTLTSPNLDILQLPADHFLDARHDSTNFVQRNRRGKLHVLVKSLIWGIYFEQFFSSPFGFGALGPSEGNRRVIELLKVWRGLVGEGESQGSVFGNHNSESDLFEAFYNSRRANNWRSSTFQSIVDSLDNTNNSSDQSFPSLSVAASLHRDNIDETVKRIVSLYEYISSVSGVAIKPTLTSEVRQLTTLVGELALQFGVHPARLNLIMPKSGDAVELGTDYADFQDGVVKGRKPTVDIVVIPGLQKVGDGRADLTTKRTILACQLYPQKR